MWLGCSGVSCRWRRGGICRKRTSPFKRSYFFETEEVCFYKFSLNSQIWTLERTPSSSASPTTPSSAFSATSSRRKSRTPTRTSRSTWRPWCRWRTFGLWSLRRCCGCTGKSAATSTHSSKIWQNSKTPSAPLTRCPGRGEIRMYCRTLGAFICF